MPSDRLRDLCPSALEFLVKPPGSPCSFQPADPIQDIVRRKMSGFTPSISHTESGGVCLERFAGVRQVRPQREGTVLAVPLETPSGELSPFRGGRRRSLKTRPSASPAPRRWIRNRNQTGISQTQPATNHEGLGQASGYPIASLRNPAAYPGEVPPPQLPDFIAPLDGRCSRLKTLPALRVLQKT